MADNAFARPDLSLRDRVRPVVAMAVACFRADPARASLSVGLRGLAAAAPPAFAAALAALVASTRPGTPWTALAVAALVLGAAVTARNVLDEIGWKIVQILEERTSHLVDREVIALVTGLPGLEHLERPDHLDRIERIEDEQWLLAMSVEALVDMAVLLFQIGITIVMLVSVDVRLLALPLFAIPSLAAGAKAERIRWRVLEIHQSDWRRREDLMKLCTEAAPAKELRVFGLGPELLRRQRAVSSGMEKWERDHRILGAYLVSAGRVVFALGYVGAIGLIASGVAAGTVPVSDLVLAVVLSGQVMAQLQGASGNANWVAWTFTAVRRWLWLLDYAAGHPARRGELLPAPRRLMRGIRLEGVAFRYPGTDADVLSGVDLELPAGSTVAIVGDNGAGKTTLVKLLSRFYEPSEGRVLVDGVDLAAIDVESWRARSSAAFQDHARLELRARDTIGVGDLSRIGDDAALVAALERGGVAEVLDALPSGLDTQLGARWPEGVDLSGGEWQKLALGRAMLREAPLLLVLDEPTAALDAETEHRLFERYAATAREAAAASGTVTVLVSHRFSTVRMADLIIVVADGRVAECGGHDELTAAGGLYAELYGMQARAYR